MSTAAQSPMPVVSAGIDVSKAKLDIHLLLADKDGVHFTVPNTLEGIRKISTNFRKHSVTGVLPVVVESTGDCHLLLCLLLVQEGFAVRLINPLITKKYQRASIRGGKTDRIDAKRLAQIGVMEDEKYLPLFTETIASVSRKKLLSLLKQLQKVQQQLTASLGQWQETAKILMPFGFPRTELPDAAQALAAIGTANAALEALITDRAVAELPPVTELAKIKGISLTQAAILLTGLEGKVFTDRDQLVSFAGIDIRPRESGQWRGQRKLSKRGNARYPPDKIVPPAICPPELVSLKTCQSKLSLKLNFDRDPNKSPSAELKEAEELDPMVGHLMNIVGCALDALPLAGTPYPFASGAISML